MNENIYYAISCPCGDTENCPGLKCAVFGPYSQLIASPDLSTIEASCIHAGIPKEQIIEIKVTKGEQIYPLKDIE